MAYNTSGFQLTQFPRSPAIPGNVGAVDVKEIYDGVRQGLAAMENVRRAPASMALADAQMQAATQAAPLQTSILAEQAAQAPAKTRQVLAQTTGIEEQMPLATRQKAAQAKIAEAESTPEFLDAKMQALLLKSQPNSIRELRLLTANMTPEDQARALRIYAGLEAKAAATPFSIRAIMGGDGRTYQQVFNRASGKTQFLAEDGTLFDSLPGTATAAPVSAPTAAAPVAIPAADSIGGDAAPPIVATIPPIDEATKAAPSPFRSPTIGEQAGAKAGASEKAKIGAELAAADDLASAAAKKTGAVETAKQAAEHTAKLIEARPKREFAIKKAALSTSRLVDDLDKVINQATQATTGPGGVILSVIPGTEATNIRANVEALKSGILLEALQDLKMASPSGASGFGNLSNQEGDRIAAQFGNLDPKQGREQFIENARKIQQRVRQNQALAELGFTREYESLGNQAQPESQSGKFKIIEVK